MNVFGMLKRIISQNDSFAAEANARMAVMDRQAEEFAKTCEICSGIVYLCPDCKRPIKSHSHENDYLCDCLDPALVEFWASGGSSSRCGNEMRFVNPVREHDGARISGYGLAGPMRVIE